MGKSRLKVILAELDLTQTDLAYMTDLSRQTISAICNGRRPRIETAHKIADALNIHINRVFPDTFLYKNVITRHVTRN